MLHGAERTKANAAYAARLTRDQLDFTAMALARGGFGVAALAVVVAGCFSAVAPLGSIAVENAVAFSVLVAIWSAAALRMVAAYRRAAVADAALPVWHRRFLILVIANGLCWGSAAFLLWAPGYPLNNFALVMLCIFSIANAAAEHGDSRTFFFGLTGATLSVTALSIAIHANEMSIGAAILLTAGTAWFSLMATHAHSRFAELVLTRVTNEDLAAGNSVARDEALRLKAKAETASSAKSAFLANMSHELRTPLNAIIGFSQVVRDEMFGPVGNPRYKEYVSDIERSGQHLLGIINDLLDVAKIEAGRMELRRDWTQPSGFIEEAVRVVRGHPAAVGARIVTSFQHGTSMVYADARMLRQAVINLISNAVKHNLPGEPVTVSTRTTGDGALRIEIADKGAGIPAHMLEKVFEVFEQADNSYAREKQGTGLGLALVKAFVTAHGGTVWLESGEGRGTCAVIELPKPAPAAVSRAA